MSIINWLKLHDDEADRISFYVMIGICVVTIGIIIWSLK